MARSTIKTLIVGLGQTGLSVLRFLHGLGESVAVADSRERPPMLADLRERYPGVPISLGGFRSKDFCACSRIVLSPGVPLAEPAVQAAIAAGVEVIGDIELFAHHADAPVVAVTGSNGKSTVVSLLQAMAQAAGRRTRAGGNLGPPALDLLAGGEVDFYLLELSSFQLETTRSLALAAAAVLNVSADHMDRYADLSSYATAKWKIYERAEQRIYNRDDGLSRPPQNRDSNWRAFALRDPAAEDYQVGVHLGQAWLMHGARALMPVAELGLRGGHNQANALAALALGDAMGLELPAMRDALRAFSGLPHRSQWLACVAGVDWYDDSKGTNVGATKAALEGFERPLVWIAGGDGKGADFRALRETVAERVRAAVLIGRDAQRLAAALDGCVPVHFATSMPAAVEIAAGLAVPGDAVLLSPACASFDMFDGFAHRGRMFAAAVEGLRA